MSIIRGTDVKMPPSSGRHPFRRDIARPPSNQRDCGNLLRGNCSPQQGPPSFDQHPRQAYRSPPFVTGPSNHSGGHEGRGGERRDWHDERLAKRHRENTNTTPHELDILDVLEQSATSKSHEEIMKQIAMMKSSILSGSNPPVGGQQQVNNFIRI